MLIAVVFGLLCTVNSFTSVSADEPKCEMKAASIKEILAKNTAKKVIVGSQTGENKEHNFS